MKKKVLSFDRLHKVGTTVYGQQGFCGVIATAVALDCSFGKADALLQRSGAREGDRTGTRFDKMLDVISEYAGVVESEIKVNTLAQLADLSAREPESRFIVLTDKGNHVVCARAGVVEDFNGPRKQVFRSRVWRVMPK